LPLPRKNITSYKSNYLHHVKTQCAIWCIHAPMRPPSKISTAVKTTCERIAPSKSFLGAVYNHGRLYSDIYFTGRHWLLLAPSKLQSSQIKICLVLGLRIRVRVSVKFMDSFCHFQVHKSAGPHVRTCAFYPVMG